MITLISIDDDHTFGIARMPGLRGDLGIPAIARMNQCSSYSTMDNVSACDYYVIKWQIFAHHFTRDYYSWNPWSAGHIALTQADDVGCIPLPASSQRILSTDGKDRCLSHDL